MMDKKISNEKKQNKIISKFKKTIFSNINENEHVKNRKKEKSNKNIKKEREKEKISKEDKERDENKSYIGEKNEQSKNSSNNNIFKNEKFIVHKSLNSPSMAKVIIINIKGEKSFKYEEEGKRKKYNNDENNNSEEDTNSQEKENKCYHIGKNKKFNKKETCGNDYIKNLNTRKKIFGKNNVNTEILKNNKNVHDENELKRKKNIYSLGKLYKLNTNYYVYNFIENKNIENYLKIQRRFIAEFASKYKIKLNKIYIISFYVIISNIVFFSYFIKCTHRKIELSSSYINLKIIGTGYIKIFSSDFQKDNYPDILIINSKTSYNDSRVTNRYNFNNPDKNVNNVTLIWNKPPNSTINMFTYCERIIEIDLSAFDISQVLSMESMFSDCSSLKSLIFPNIKTTQLRSMNSMFFGCSSLNSLDLSNFDTSSVTNMGKMFYQCSSLQFLDLSHFNTSQVSEMDLIFSNC